MSKYNFTQILFWPQKFTEIYFSEQEDAPIVPQPTLYQLGTFIGSPWRCTYSGPKGMSAKILDFHCCEYVHFGLYNGDVDPPNW